MSQSLWNCPIPHKEVELNLRGEEGLDGSSLVVCSPLRAVKENNLTIHTYNNNDFMICSKDIYPESIPLTAGCIENNKDTFLDLDITIEENRFITKIYHKVDDFDFEEVNFPFPTNNMSDHITYNSFYSQLVRFSSVCSKFNDFDIHSRN